MSALWQYSVVNSICLWKHIKTIYDKLNSVYMSWLRSQEVNKLCISEEDVKPWGLFRTLSLLKENRGKDFYWIFSCSEETDGKEEPEWVEKNCKDFFIHEGKFTISLLISHIISASVEKLKQCFLQIEACAVLWKYSSYHCAVLYCICTICEQGTCLSSIIDPVNSLTWMLVLQCVFLSGGGFSS